MYQKVKATYNLERREYILTLVCSVYIHCLLLFSISSTNHALRLHVLLRYSTVGVLGWESHG
jgi:hypothetical protein